MKTILIVCVNYNSYDALWNYLQSIADACQKCNDFSIEIKIADNSSKPKVVDFQILNLNIALYKFSNLGYFGAAFQIINSLSDVSGFDYVFITNVDVILPDNFFTKLSNVSLNDNVGWIAPNIISLTTNKRYNPYIVERYSKLKIELIELMYRFPFVHKIYNRTIHQWKKNKRTAICNNMEIYAGHGSFFILTRPFFLDYKPLTYPVFLFGEEIFIAETIKEKKLKVEYVPSLLVYDKDHVSTKHMSNKSHYKAFLESIQFIKNRYYR